MAKAKRTKEVRTCPEEGCENPIHGQQVYCDSCIKIRTAKLNNEAKRRRVAKKKGKVGDGYDWLREANAFLEWAKKRGLNYAQAQVIDNIERGRAIA